MALGSAAAARRGVRLLSTSGQAVWVDELVVPSELCRNATDDPEAVLDGAVWLIGHMCEHIGVTDLGGLDVLDFGCGVRFTQAFLNRGVPIKHYVGVDVSRDVVEFLQSNVSDPRFEYFHLNAHNDSYNPTGQPLSELTVPEIEGRRFDLICMFSVITHMVPADYSAMLKLLRRFIKPDGKLFYTLFINERTDGGHGYVDQLSRAMAASNDSRMKEMVGARMARGGEPPDFVDAWAGKGMMAALYSRRHALELIDGTGWKVLSVSDPDVRLQHHIVCTPVAHDGM